MKENFWNLVGQEIGSGTQVVQQPDNLQLTGRKVEYINTVTSRWVDNYKQLGYSEP